MLPSDHIAVAALASAALIRRDAKPLTCIAAGVMSHYALDSIPHAEPSFFGSFQSYLHFGTLEFAWTFGDHVIALAIIMFAMSRYAVLRDGRFLLFCFFAWVPDCIEPFQRWTGISLEPIASIHASSHLLWRNLLNVQPGVASSLSVWIIGLTTYIGFWFTPLWLLDRAPKEYSEPYKPAFDQALP